MDCIVDSLFSVFVTLGELVTVLVGLVVLYNSLALAVYVLQLGPALWH